MAKSVREELLLEGMDVPVIEPIVVAAAIPEIGCDMGFSHIKHTWLQPPIKSMPGIINLEFT
jgi:hypothetical protein